MLFTYKVHVTGRNEIYNTIPHGFSTFHARSTLLSLQSKGLHLFKQEGGGCNVDLASPGKSCALNRGGSRVDLTSNKKSLQNHKLLYSREFLFYIAEFFVNNF